MTKAQDRKAMEARIAAGNASPEEIQRFNISEMTRYFARLASITGDKQATECREFAGKIANFDASTQLIAISRLAETARHGSQSSKKVLVAFARAVSGDNSRFVERTQDFLKGIDTAGLVNHLLGRSPR